MKLLSCVVLVSALPFFACAEPAAAPEVHQLAPVAPEDALKLPELSATAPANYPGLHNVVAYHDGFLSGSVPEGDEGFESLRRMGIRTVISVDGALPDVALAKAHGLRYVHLPIGYNGMSSDRTLEIARAVHDLPHPLYLHCHHGKHRSAGAAGAAAVTLGYATPEQATVRMKVSGTAENYKGLYQCVSVAKIADAATLARADATFPEIAKTPSFVQAMVEIDEDFDGLKAIEKAGWRVPQDHQDLVPVTVAAKLENLFRQLESDPSAASRPQGFRDMLGASRANAQHIEDELAKPAPSLDVLAREFKALTQDCKQCHAKFRD